MCANETDVPLKFVGFDEKGIRVDAICLTGKKRILTHVSFHQAQ